MLLYADVGECGGRVVPGRRDAVGVRIRGRDVDLNRGWKAHRIGSRKSSRALPSTKVEVLSSSSDEVAVVSKATVAADEKWCQ